MATTDKRGGKKTVLVRGVSQINIFGSNSKLKEVLLMASLESNQIIIIIKEIQAAMSLLLNSMSFFLFMHLFFYGLLHLKKFFLKVASGR